LLFGGVTLWLGARLINPAKTCLFIPAGLKKFKLELFERIAANVESLGGIFVRHDPTKLDVLPREIIPIVGCHPETTDLIARWRSIDRPWIYWDRGYFKRWFAAGTPKPKYMEDSYYRWHLNGFQMQSVADVPDDRWKAMKLQPHPWKKNGKHIVIAAPSKTYMRFHRIEGWLEQTMDTLARITGRQMVIRHKEQVLTREILKDLDGAHCLVTHGSIAAVEAVYYGCPVFVHPDSAAAIVGLTDLKKIESPIYPEREAWLHALAYCQYNEHELVNGTLWRLMR
jgi:hypothetical protein